MNKRKINEDYFNEINDAKKAYWLGFIAADGYINSSCSKICIYIKDLDVLQKFNADISSDYKISEITQKDKRTGKTYKEYSLQISNRNFINGIVKNGITHEKTDVLSFPNIDDEYYPYFIAGLFDGDGSIFTNNSSNGIKCSLISTNEVLDKIDNILYEKFAITPNKHIKITDAKPNVFKEHWYKNSEKFLEYIYCGDKEIYLSRKYNIYKNHLYKNKTRNGTQPILKYSIDGIFLEKYDSIKDAAKENNCSEQIIINSHKRNEAHKGFYWKRYVNGEKIEKKIEVIKNYKYEIQQIFDDKIINVFHSLRDAEKNTGIKHSNICNCINNKSKTAGGFIWKKVELK